MADRTILAALLGLCGADVAAVVATVRNGEEPLRVIDALVRDVESDVERIRQQLDELLRGGGSVAVASEGVPTMIEDILATLAAKGYVVSNTFQLGEGDSRCMAFGRSGWQVYLRNLRNTRAGQGAGATLAEAFEAALAACEAQLAGAPTVPPSPRLPLPPPRALYVALDTTADEQSDLF